MVTKSSKVLRCKQMHQGLKNQHCKYFMSEGNGRQIIDEIHKEKTLELQQHEV